MRTITRIKFPSTANSAEISDKAAIICRMENRDSIGGETEFSDVSKSHWAYRYITINK